MKFSQLLNNTLRKDQVSNDIISFQMLIRAGYFRATESGDYQERHLGSRLYANLQKQIENMLSALQGASQKLASLLPIEVLYALNYNRLLKNAVKINDDSGTYLTGIPSVDIAAEIAHFELNTYKQLPLLFYDFQNHTINRKATKSGLAGIKNVKTAEIISLSENTEAQNCIKEQILTKLYDFFKNLSVPVISVKSSYYKDEQTAEMLLYECSWGNVSYFTCTNCEYKADSYACSSKKTEYTGSKAKMEKVYTPSVSTIEALAEYLKTEPYHCGKVVFYSTITKQKEKKIVMAMVRGDTNVNEHKLQKHLNLTILKPATENEIEAIGAVVGFASASGIDRQNTIVIVDKLVEKTQNLIVGANEKDFHLLNVCYGRDFKADEIADIIETENNDACPVCGKALVEKYGIAVADVISYKQLKFKQQTIEFTNQQGKPQMVCANYIRLSITNLIAATVEQNHDQDGLQLSESIAPYQVILLTISKNTEVKETANKLYQQLTASGIDVLYDNRDIKSAGIKFKDADLTGIPIRCTISPRSLKNGTIECRIRNSGDKHTIPSDEILPFVKSATDCRP